MFTADQAQYLLQLPKKVEKNGMLQDEIILSQPFPFQERYNLISPNDAEFTFLYEINQSKRNHFKLTLYLMDVDTRLGLVWVDYRGQHENPHSISDKVPGFLHPYTGRFFDYEDHHIHYYVEGYKTTLDWALPLSDASFPVKQINHANDVIQAFQSFNKVINLKTLFTIHPLLL